VTLGTLRLPPRRNAVARASKVGVLIDRGWTSMWVPMTHAEARGMRQLKAAAALGVLALVLFVGAAITLLRHVRWVP
jgi:hypothetical protein